MSFFDRLLGRQQPAQPQQPAQAYPPAGQPYPGHPGYSGQPGQPLSADEQAIKRYQYLLQTADPADVERVHAEAFAKLTPQQRQEVLSRLSTVAPQERPTDDSPRALARAATRAEMRNPGTLTNAFGGMFGGGGRMGGMGMGGMGGGLLTSIAGTALGVAAGYGLIQGIDAMFGDGLDQGVDALADHAGGLADQAGEFTGQAGEFTDQAGHFAEQGFSGEQAAPGPSGDAGGYGDPGFADQGFADQAFADQGFDDLGGGFDDAGMDFGGEF